MQVRVERGAGHIIVGSPFVQVEIDLAGGLWSADWRKIGGARFLSAGCGAKLADGRDLFSGEYPAHSCEARDIVRISDEFGLGERITVHHRRPGSPDLAQTFRVYENLPYFLVGLDVVADTPVSTNDISPVLVDESRRPGAGVVLGTTDKPHSLFVPYDNDAFVRYSSDYASESYEVTAIYDNQSRRGFVIGSVTHDLWKTGIAIGGWDAGRVGSLRVYGGIADKNTRDAVPHGLVTGNTVAAPQVFIGCFPDWREGLETYGHANARVAPPISWEAGPPFGWNSWYAYMAEVNNADFQNASRFLKGNLQPQGFADKGTVYVNLDSFWDNIKEDDLVDSVKQIHGRGQKAGIYWTPFVFWGNNQDLGWKVDGTEGRYTYEDVVLKDATGKPLAALDGGLPMDPTHPATLTRIDWQTQRFIQWGFDFVKLDFMTHGALEAEHFDKSIATGTAAYNLGMKRIVENLSPARVGRSFFIGLSIAPLFPAGYGHSRRISCDVWPNIGATEYLLNSLTYGWWIGGSVYSLNDPDITTLYQAHGSNPTTPDEGRSRLNASVIAGGILLDGDDLTNPQAQQRAEQMLTNKAINDLARMGRSFRPIEGDTGSHAADWFVYEDARRRRLFLAVFNYDGANKVTKQVELARIGLKPDRNYRAVDLWTGASQSLHGTLSIDLPPAGSTILQIDISP